MKLQVVSYRGATITSSTLSAWLPVSAPPAAQTQVIEINRSGKYPAYAGKSFQSWTFPVQFGMTGTLPAQQVDSLRQMFDLENQTPGTLVFQDAADSNKQYYVMAVPVSMPSWEYRFAQVNMNASDPTWRSMDTYAGTITAAGSVASGTLTVGGNLYTRPTISITPSSAGTVGYAYREYVTVINQAPVPFQNLPYDLGGTAGYDTATLVSAGKMQATCADLRVMVDGVETDYWLDAPNSSTTHVWCNLSLPGGTTCALGTAITSGGTVTTLGVRVDATNSRAFDVFPSSGIVRIDSEEFAYTGKSKTKTSYTLTGVTRSVRDTSAGNHSANATIYQVAHDIQFLYGNPSASAISADDARKPIIELTSTNAAWTFANFQSADKLRSGGWTSAIVTSASQTAADLTQRSDTYTATQETDADPASVMGMTARAYQKKATWAAESCTLAWSIYHPAGITQVAASGSKYRNATSWPSTAALQKSTTGATWTNVVNQTTPGTVSTWTAWTFSGTSLGGTVNYIRFAFAGAIAASANARASFEISDVTLTMPASRVPVVYRNSEQTNYTLTARITNVTTGAYIDLNYGMATGNTITIDTENRTATYNDINAIGGVSPSRVDEWLKLVPGANEIAWTTEATDGTASLVFSWRERKA